jgi:Ca-activated chloride channel family protein
MVPRLFALATLLAVLPTHVAPPPDEVLSHRAVQVVGKVWDATNGTPLSDVQVYLPGANRGALSRTDGRYIISLADGMIGQEVAVRFERIGLATEVRTLKLVSGDNVLDVPLWPQALGLDEIVVSGTAGAASRREVDNRVTQAPATADNRTAQVRPTAVPYNPAAVPPERLAAVAAPPTVAAPSPAPPPPAAIHPGGNPSFNTESYARIEENAFLAARDNALSTFSIDVDRASYANVRRFIRTGQRPPVDAVRIEEMVNYFPYEDPTPRGRVPFTVTTEVGQAPWQPLHKLVRIALRARSVGIENLPPNNLVFLVDVSGSMAAENKLPLVKTSLKLLVEQLREQDRVALVVYAGAAGLVLPPTPGNQKTTILDAIERLQSGGSTAGGAGLRLAYAVAAEHHMAEGNNRVILATDGDFNVGVSSDSEMIQLIEEKRAQGTYLTVLGYGTGNLKDSKMEQIADHGNGNFAYIDSPKEAKKALVTEMGGTLLTVAQDVKIQVEFNPALVAGYRLIGYENRLLAKEDFNDDTKDAGEIGAGHSVVALYEVVPVGVESPASLRETDALRYQQESDDARRSNASSELMFVKVRYKNPGEAESQLITHPVRNDSRRLSTDFRFAAAVAAWGMLLRNSPHIGTFGLSDVSILARASLGDDPGGYRAEFLELVESVNTRELLAGSPREQN